MIKIGFIINALFAIFLGAYAIEANPNHIILYTGMTFYCAWFPAVYWFENDLLYKQ